LVGCSPKIGDTGIADRDYNVVENYDSSSLNKLECTIIKDELVTVVDISTLWLGTGMSEEIVKLRGEESGCSGWGFTANVKKNLNIEEK
jgi:hypothetical protein